MVLLIPVPAFYNVQTPAVSYFESSMIKIILSYRIPHFKPMGIFKPHDIYHVIL
jgi:hypothetical protein